MSKADKAKSRGIHNKQCLDVTESFRVGDRTKGEAILAIENAINVRNYDPSVFVASFDEYIRMLDNIEQHRSAVAQ